MAADLLYKVAYDEAVRALSEQQQAIDGFRSRAGLLLSAAAITTSFLGTQALRGGNPGPLAWLALAGFVGVAAVCLAILWPRRWEFTASSHELIGTYVESPVPAPLEELHRELSFHMHRSHAENRQGLQKLVVFFQIASVLLVAEVVLWIVAIAMTS